MDYNQNEFYLKQLINDAVEVHSTQIYSNSVDYYSIISLEQLQRGQHVVMYYLFISH